MKIEEIFESKFKCPKCKSERAIAKKIATTGTGLSKIFDIQMNRFLAVSCENCGYTELYNLNVIEKRGDTLSNLLDFIFG